LENINKIEKLLARDNEKREDTNSKGLFERTKGEEEEERRMAE
jgi:hypothetical protein